jgi:hypothetical protein
MRPITFICAYYENPGMLLEQQCAWRAYPDYLKAQFHVIVTDDGSPTRPARPHVVETGIASFRLYRTLVDVRWNWLFCRNLGVEMATTDWVLLTDIDHVLPASTLNALVTDRLDSEVVYRFSRVDAPNLTPYKPHPNSWFMTRAMFNRIGGYDERFSGYYGTDSEFRERVHGAARAVVLRTDALMRYPREVIADASTTTYGRKEPQDRENVTRIRDERAKDRKWRPLRVTFPYERLI